MYVCRYVLHCIVLYCIVLYCIVLHSIRLCCMAWHDGCMHACMHACMCACMYVCMYVCMFVCLFVCSFACTYVTYVTYAHLNICRLKLQVKSDYGRDPCGLMENITLRFPSHAGVVHFGIVNTNTKASQGPMSRPFRLRSLTFLSLAGRMYPGHATQGWVEVHGHNHLSRRISISL